MLSVDTSCSKRAGDEESRTLRDEINILKEELENVKKELKKKSSTKEVDNSSSSSISTATGKLNNKTRFLVMVGTMLLLSNYFSFSRPFGSNYILEIKNGLATASTTTTANSNNKNSDTKVNIPSSNKTIAHSAYKNTMMQRSLANESSKKVGEKSQNEKQQQPEVNTKENSSHAEMSSSLSLSSSSKFLKGDDIGVVVLFNYKYSLFAERFLQDWREKSKMDGCTMYCIDGAGDNPNTTKTYLSNKGLCDVWLSPTSIPSNLKVHYAKLEIFTNPLFRKHKVIFYIDVDHRLIGPVQIPSPPWKNNKTFLAMGSKLSKNNYENAKTTAKGRYQDFKMHRVKQEFKEKMVPSYGDLHNQGYSTRTVIVDVKQLPSVQEIQNNIQELMDYNVHLASKYWEQGFLLALFWNSTGSVCDVTDLPVRHFLHMACVIEKKGQPCKVVDDKKYLTPTECGKN